MEDKPTVNPLARRKSVPPPSRAPPLTKMKSLTPGNTSRKNGPVRRVRRHSMSALASTTSRFELWKCSDENEMVMAGKRELAAPVDDANPKSNCAPSDVPNEMPRPGVDGSMETGNPSDQETRDQPENGEAGRPWAGKSRKEGKKSQNRGVKSLLHRRAKSSQHRRAKSSQRRRAKSKTRPLIFDAQEPQKEDRPESPVIRSSPAVETTFMADYRNLNVPFVMKSPGGAGSDQRAQIFAEMSDNHYEARYDLSSIFRVRSSSFRLSETIFPALRDLTIK
mmetsp:Transcript_27159/g.66050  ORF Transcript_27159/g.66050 Transcript_27159/m.66050 type:complete len:279 (-) Transcript_27159:81-917(-)